MLSLKTYLRIMRASAIYDIVTTIGFATPWSVAILFQLLQQADIAFNLPGDIPQIDMVHILFANLMGSLVLVWSMVRLHLNLAVLGRYDAVARFLFASWQIVALMNGASFIIIPLLVVEIAFGLAQLLPIDKKLT